MVTLGLLMALPAHARVRKKRKAATAVRPVPVRPEDDLRKRGNSPAFRKASLRFASPADLSEIRDGPIPIKLMVKGYAIGALKPRSPVPHVHLIVDNEPALQIDDVGTDWKLSGVPPGPHLVRAVLCRPWHEVVKAPKAFAIARFWVGPKLSGKAGRAAEFVAWPQPRKPLLTYVLPIGAPAENLQLLPDAAPAGAPVTDPAEPELLAPSANRPVLDFYVSNGKLGRRGDKVRIVLDKRELPLITEWKPLPMRRAHKGARRVITIDLLNRRGLKVNNAVNRTDRVFTVSG